MNLGFLGSGRITLSIINGILNSKIQVKKIFISYRNKNISRKLSNKFKKVEVLKDNQEIINKSNLLFLAVTPKVGKKILPIIKILISWHWINVMSPPNSCSRIIFHRQDY